MKGLEDQDGLSETGEPPQAPEIMEQDNRVLVLPVNGESRKITQILSNETSLKILELLGEKEHVCKQYCRGAEFTPNHC